MLSFTRFLALSTLAVSIAQCDVIAPAYQGIPADDSNSSNFNGTTTDSASITDTANQVANINETYTGATANTPPNAPAANTTITAVDGNLVNGTVPTSTTRRSLAQTQLSRRNDSNYELAFWGTGTDPEDRDASIMGTAYLTYTVVDNSTYNIDDCLAFCDSVPGCVYYEYNNYLLDFVFSQKSNLKCAIYGDVHSAGEKLNWGGQSSYGNDGPLTYIQQSTGWTSKSLGDPTTPDGYEPVGEFIGANEAPGYMGFVFLDQYDVEACAALCYNRDADAVGGVCQYFNIWRAVVKGVPTTYTCSMYYIPTDNSTAINYGQGDLVVTWSRGYKRTNYVQDGNFEAYTCEGGLNFCFTQSDSTWTGSSPQGGDDDATIFHYEPYAHSGTSVGLLGSAYDSDSLAGTLAPAKSLATEQAVNYIIQFFHSSSYSGQEGEKNAFVDVIWNGVVIATITPGYSVWKPYQYRVSGRGDDTLAFTGGSAPAYSFIDDISVFEV
ncbi:hypothetical protein BT96DRAFT_964469 [Gymnopus androsaceus JB14]|uniref:Fruit-body specific protein a n=1 Tax=Gymnopus androsaceus JB14 TaxID=1447944 RepID=A0A6A4HZP3_9AGAR|nr:hypothetical protein BT96DRAFT_964469 [Gymnopus androsaceus JB14]